MSLHATFKVVGVGWGLLIIQNDHTGSNLLHPRYVHKYIHMYCIHFCWTSGIWKAYSDLANNLFLYQTCMSWMLKVATFIVTFIVNIDQCSHVTFLTLLSMCTWLASTYRIHPTKIKAHYIGGPNQDGTLSFLTLVLPRWTKWDTSLSIMSLRCA